MQWHTKGVFSRKLSFVDFLIYFIEVLGFYCYRIVLVIIEIIIEFQWGSCYLSCKSPLLFLKFRFQIRSPWKRTLRNFTWVQFTWLSLCNNFKVVLLFFYIFRLLILFAFSCLRTQTSFKVDKSFILPVALYHMFCITRVAIPLLAQYI